MPQGSLGLDDNSDDGSDVDDGDDFRGSDHAVLEKFVNVFRYHFLDTETSFSRLSYLHAALISSNSSPKIPAR